MLFSDYDKPANVTIQIHIPFIEAVSVDGQSDTNAFLLLTGLYWSLPETQQAELIRPKLRDVCLTLLWLLT